LHASLPCLGSSGAVEEMAAWAQTAWHAVLEADKTVTGLADAWVPLALFLATYWAVGLGFLLIDRPWAAEIKCQPGKYVAWPMVRKIAAYVGAQHLTVYPATMWLLSGVVRRFCSFSSELPSTRETVAGLVFCIFFAEVYFFHVHWALHHPRIYPYVHKVHHEFTYPIALESLYFHPVESVLNFGLGAGPMILGAHVTLLYLFTVIAVANVCIHHCGHEVPLDSPPFFGSMTHQHDYHHKVFNRNFGVIGICDWLYGTRAGYDAYHERWEQARKEKKRRTKTE